MKKSIWIIVIASFSYLISCNDKETRKNEKSIFVKVQSTGSEIGSGFLSASGTIDAENSSNISTRMMGYITKFHVKTGQKVHSGQLLVSINSADISAKKAHVEASIIQANAAYNNARKDYERFKNLFNTQSASQKELDDMTARYEMAKAGLEAAQAMRKEIQAQFSYLNLTAPFSGTITNTFAKEGDMANPGMPLISIEGNGNLQVNVMVSENAIRMVKQGMPVKILVKSLDKTFEGKVSEVSNSSKNTGGQYVVKINILNKVNEMKSGMFVQVQFPIQTDENIQQNSQKSVWIPENAIIEEGQLKGIYVVGAQKNAILRWIRVGKKSNNLIEVLSGLTQGEYYITESSQKLYNGAKISY